jgi:hypothetical protein
MKKIISNDRDYVSYKNNLIFESLISVPDRNCFYGLSREHIELTLGIKTPMLLESIDFKLEDKILREQYLFEAWYNTVATAAGSAGRAVKTAAGVVGGAVKTAAEAMALGKVRDTAGIFKALSIIVRYPTLVKELGDSLSDYVTKLLRPVVALLELVIKWVKDKANKLLVAINTTFTAAKNTIQSLLTRFSSLAGWQKVALGAGLAILGAWVSSIIGPKIEILTGKLTKAIGEVGSKVVDVGKKVAGAAVDATVAAAKPEFGEDRGALAVGKALTGSALEDPLTELGKEILPELQALATTVLKKLALPTTLATLSLFAGPLGPFLLGVGTLVAKSSLIITTLAPITNRFIDKYNAIIGNKPAGQLQSSAERRRGRELGPSTTPTFDAAAARIGAAAGAVRSRAAAGVGAVRSAVGLEEHSVLLSDLLYI